MTVKTSWIPKILGVLLVALALGGCRTADLYNVQETALGTSQNVKMMQVEQAIERAGESLGWYIRRADDNQPGHLIGRLPIRSHVAVVDIHHDTETFSITYRDSTNLGYDAKKGVIHPNYNGWIKNLRNAIQREAAVASET